MRARFAFASLAALALASPAAAQQVAQINEAAGALGGGARATPATLPPVTQITPDTVPGRSLGTTVTPVGNRSFIDNGTRAGSNLFHSFAHFDLGQGDVAAWIRSAGDGAEIAHVVNRVTGGEPSLIFGTIDSTALSNADFWFINPAGLLFGQGARLDVPAAAFFSTAQELRFASGPAFTVATPSGSTLSIASPTAFGFLGGQAPITLLVVGEDFLRPPGLLLLAGSNVMVQSSFFAAGDMRLYGFGGGPGELEIADVRPGEFAGQVDIADSTIGLGGLPGIESGVRIVGRSIDITNSNIASLAAFDVGFGASILLQAEEVTVDGSFLSTATRGAADAGNLSIFGERIRLNGSHLTSEAGFGSTGAAGNIAIGGDSVIIEDGTFVTSDTLSNRRSGDISIEGEDVIIDFSRVTSGASDIGEGDAGTIEINGGRLTIAGGSLVTSATSGDGDAGEVRINMRRGIDVDFSAISSASVGEGRRGRGGLVSISAPELTLSTRSLISTTTLGEGDAGIIDIAAGVLRLRGGGDEFLENSMISSTTSGTGRAGLIRLAVGALDMQDQTIITSSTFGPGLGGTIVIAADSVAIRNGATIASSTAGSGPGGTIDIDASSLSVDGGVIESVARGEPEGRGGQIDIRANQISLTEGGLIRANTQSDADAGVIAIAGDRLQLDRSFIASVSRGSGDAGLIDIEVDDILLANGSAITTEAFGAFIQELDDFRGGSAGDIEIDARSLRLTGGEFGGSAIATSTFTEGLGGDLLIRADQVTLEGASSIESIARRSGDAGSVRLELGDLDLSEGSQITTSSVACTTECEQGIPPTGDAGSVEIVAERDVTLRQGSAILSTAGGGGDAGVIGLVARSVILDDSGISTSTLHGSTGGSGLIALEADSLELTGTSGIETVSNNANAAGGILIDADRLLLVGPDARITSSNLFDAGGDAGGIFISAGDIALLGGARLTSSSDAGAAGTIEIFMPNDAFLLLDSTGQPSLITTSSGPGTGGRIIISSPYAIISNGGSILSLGDLGGANVEISTQFFISSADRTNLVLVDGAFLLEAQVGDVSSGTVERDLSVVDASGVLRGQCAAVRATGQVSQLIVRPTGPYGTRPDGGAEPPGSCF